MVTILEEKFADRFFYIVDEKSLGTLLLFTAEAEVSLNYQRIGHFCRLWQLIYGKLVNKLSHFIK